MQNSSWEDLNDEDLSPEAYVRAMFAAWHTASVAELAPLHAN